MKNKLIFLLMIGMISHVTSVLADKAVFAGGCFWCMESDFEKLPGVTDVISGFTGGVIENPTYNGNHRGHYEAVEVSYDSKKVLYNLTSLLSS